ncbi:MAG: phosphate signaling complex protein PhoU [Candidatus Competibacteraceae bacterium]|nr:phosphate signaling complex protein PhoU [Candidatus Competibacteraceae bacterium]
MASHTVKAFEDDLNALEALVADLGQCVVPALDEALTALLETDRDAARTVIANDAQTDALTAQINSEVLRITARWQPVADDLRKILGCERIAANLERVGDHAKNIAKRSLLLDEPITAPQVALLKRLAESVAWQLQQVLAALAGQDAELAQAVWLKDTQADELHDDLFYHVLADMREGRGPIVNGVHVLFAAKGLERIGDHATNIAEAVRFMVAGITSEPRPHA